MFDSAIIARREISQRFDDALALAHEFHRTQFRKETSTPYFAHLLQVAGLVLEAGGDEDQAIAGLLHDAIEDASGPREAKDREDRISEAFGDRVLRIVRACTDGDPAEKQALPWRKRKERYLEHLATVDPDVLLVSVSDKLHNARAVLRDYRAGGEALWKRFNGRKSGTLWYYRSLARFYSGTGVAYSDELAAVVEDLERLATRGSRRHVLNWVSAPEFVASLNALLEPTGAVVLPDHEWRPRGWHDRGEAKLDGHGILRWPDIEWVRLQGWWLAEPHGANVPNWDLLALCTIRGRAGLVLVEAKAHDRELSTSGKPAPSESDASQGNHERIGAAIEEARAGLERLLPGIAISRDRSYQLSNRVAHAWWLATHGVPVVLMYLGFTGDERIDDVGRPFRDEKDWRRNFEAHATGVLPPDAIERPIDCGPAAFQLLVRALPVPPDRTGTFPTGRP